MRRILWILAAVLLLGAAPSAAKLKVVATTSDLASVAGTVGGPDVEVDLLCRGSSDPHYLPAKPSLARKLSKADLLVYNGLELEVAWLPQLITKARNPKVKPGARGELDCSTALTGVLDVPDGHADRGKGDIHPLGNPHYNLDPRAMVLVARRMAERLGELDADHAADYTRRAAEFAADIQGRLGAWEAAVAPARAGHVLLYHQTWTYLVHWLDLEVYGEIEHRPGISPSPKHVQVMVEQGRVLGDVIVVAATWSHIDVARQAAERIGAPLVLLPAATGADEGVDDYIRLIDVIVARIAAGAAERDGS